MWAIKTLPSPDGSAQQVNECIEKPEPDLLGAAGSLDELCGSQSNSSRSYAGLAAGLTLLAVALLAAFGWLWYRQKDQESREGTTFSKMRAMRGLDEKFM